MTKFLLAILLFVSTMVVVAHGILVYQFNATESIITEEDPSKSKTLSNDEKDFSKEHILSPFGFYRYAHLITLHLSATDNFFTYSKGYYNQPYNPPEAI